MHPNNKFLVEMTRRTHPFPYRTRQLSFSVSDDTWLVTARESRSLPDLYQNPVFINTGFCFIALFYCIMVDRGISLTHYK